MSVVVTRELLGLSDLNINDHTNYYVSNTDFMSAQISWNRQTTSSPYIDGSVTIFRTRQQTSQSMVVECLGEDQAELRQNFDIIAKAFMQDNYTLTITLNSVDYSYRCEAADYALRWDGPRFVARQVQMQFSVPCQPQPLTGVV
jgi:hypothetical protein